MLGSKSKAIHPNKLARRATKAARRSTMPRFSLMPSPSLIEDSPNRRRVSIFPVQSHSETLLPALDGRGGWTSLELSHKF